MRGRHGLAKWALLACVAIGFAPAALCAQVMAPGGIQMPSNIGMLATPDGMLTGSGKPKDEDPPLVVRDSFVNVIDGAAPRNVFGLRFDGFYNTPQPMRAEYLFAKGGLPFSVGFRRPETGVDYQDFTSYAEYSVIPWLSIFMEAPYRFINPEVNRNQHGGGDLKYGVKICTWSSDAVLASFLLRLYQPTARHATLGTSHWSFEPGLLLAYRFNEKVLVEGEFRYWTALRGSDFGGDLLRYGIGVSYGERNPAGFWYMPVAEAVGWSVLSGKTMVATSATDFLVRDADGDTILNAYLGMRLGWGRNFDFYAGYGRSFTGDIWSRDNFRFEIRFTY